VIGNDLGLLAGALALLLAPGGDEAVGDEIGLLRRKVLRAFDHAVMVGEDQAIGRNEAGRTAAGQPHGGGAHAIEPFLIGRPAVILLHRRGGKGIERPHAFIGLGRGGEQERRGKGRGSQENTAHEQGCPCWDGQRS
jgi:hypothetical protein